MLLTAGLGIGETAKRQREYLYAIDDAHAAVLIVELSGRAFTMPTHSSTPHANVNFRWSASTVNCRSSKCQHRCMSR